MGMSMRLGKSNAWSLNEDSTNNISISSELVERTSEKTTYKVIVTIDALSKRMNRRVDDGEIYVCLYEKCRDAKGYNQSHDPWDPSPAYAYSYNLVHTFDLTANSYEYLQKVVRGKNQYIYTVVLGADEYYYSNDSYIRFVDRVKSYNSKGYNFYNTYYNIGASLLHIRNSKLVYNPEIGYEEYKNTFLKSLSDSGCFGYDIYDGSDTTKTCFDKMPSFASNVCYTDLIRLDL